MPAEASGVVREDLEVSRAGTAPSDDGVPAWAPLAAMAAAVVPILVAVVRTLWRGWAPYGDDALFSVRAWDVLSRNVPLLGTASSGTGRVTERAINHPGPLQLDLLALPVRTLGHATGTAVGQALINVVALGLLAWLVHRLLGRLATTVAIAGCALLVWSMGSEVLYRPWGPYAVVLPFALYLVAVWASLAGDRVALMVAVGAGSYCLQTNLAYALLVPGLAALVVAATVLRLVHPSGAPGQAERAAQRSATVRGAAAAVALGAVLWAQPVYEQLTGPQHNLSALAHGIRGGGSTPGLGVGLRRLAQTVALPRAWLAPTFSSPPNPLLAPPPMTRAAPALALLVSATILLAWRAWRRRSPAIVAAGVTSLAALALGVVSVAWAPEGTGIPVHEIFWLWPLGLFAWLVIVLAVVDEWQASARVPFRPRMAAAAACAVALLAGVAALPTRGVGVHQPYSWAWPAVPAVEDDVFDAVRDKGPILIDMPVPDESLLIGPGLLPALQRDGIPFVVKDDSLARTLGERRRYQPGGADWELTILARDVYPAPAGHRLVAEWSAAGRAELSELDELTHVLRSALVADGLPLAPGGAERVVHAGHAWLLPIVENAREDPDAVLDSPVLALLADLIPEAEGGPVIDADRFPADRIHRWIELDNLAAGGTVRIYFGPVDDPGT